MKTHKRKRISEVTDVVAALKQKHHLHDEIRRYFYYDSDLCRALQEYLERDPKPHCLFKNGRVVRNTSAHSGVHFFDCRICTPLISIGPNRNKLGEDFLVFEFHVDLIDNDENDSQEKVQITVPAVLEKKFSKEKFVAWVKKEKSQIVVNKDESIILRIAAKYDIPTAAIKNFLTYL